MKNLEFKNFTSNFQTHFKLKDEEMNVIKDYFNRESLYKTTELIAEGEIADRIYFHSTGITVGKAANHEGIPKTIWMCNEVQAISDVFNFFHSMPSQESLIALEGSLLYYITRKDFEKLKIEYPDIKKLYRPIIDDALALKKIKAECQGMKFVTDAMIYFHSVNSYLMNKAPVSILAEYFNIDPNTFRKYRKSEKYINGIK